MDTVDVGIVACDADGHLTMFNRATRVFHGGRADPELDPGGWASRYALYDEDGRTQLTPDQVPLMRALREGAVEGVVIVIAPDGHPARTVRCDGRAMRDPDGRLLGAVVAMSDITKDRQTARALADQAEYTRVLLETAHSAIWSCDPSGRPTYVNATARDVLGWPGLEVLHDLHDRGELSERAGAVCLLGSDGEQLAADQRPLALALSGQDTGEIEVVVLAPGRPRRTMLMRATPLRDEDGDVSGALLTGHDVTALRSSEARFRAAFHDGPTPIAWLDCHGQVIDANPALQQLLRLGSDELHGRPLVDHVLADDQQRLTAALSGTGAGSEAVEVRLRLPTGQPLWCEVATTITEDSDGVSTVLVQFLDVDDRKTQELALEQAAFHDPLTGLGNRTQLGPLVSSLLQSGADPSAGLLFVDLDGFKTINDRYGHEAGDAVLAEVARRLVAAVRPDDVVLRIGGDEFVVVCPTPTTRSGQLLHNLAARLEEAVAAPFTFGTAALTIGASIGTAAAASGQTLQQLVEAADRSMYRRKRERALA